MKALAAQPGTQRVAIYTRQSLDEGTGEYKSVHSQRDAIEAYIKSQVEKGWKALPEKYEDAGYGGGDTNRPAFKKLLADVDAGRIDVVAVYKLDRLSRNLHDFVSLMDTFEKRGVTFVSVTESFTTSTSMGRMVMNMVANFAQYERETIGERTKDKMGAMRRRGLWAGGPVPLGYDVVSKKLVVNADEAEQVRAIFRLYLEKGSLLATANELNARGWRTKSWVGKRGVRIASYLYSMESLRQLLNRVVYIGLIKAGKETFKGVHEPIIDQELWDAVHALKRRVTPSPGIAAKNKYGALLRGFLWCGLCGSSMNHQTSGARERVNRSYRCNRGRRFGTSQCPATSVRVDQLEGFVIDRVRAIGRDPALVGATIEAVRAERQARVVELETEIRRQELERRRAKDERTNLVNVVAGGGAGTGTLMAKVAELDDRLAAIDGLVLAAQRDLAAASKEIVDDGSLQAALAEFDGLWDQLFPVERGRILALLIERITYASTTGALKITFRTSGLKGLG